MGLSRGGGGQGFGISSCVVLCCVVLCCVSVLSEVLRCFCGLCGIAYILRGLGGRVFLTVVCVCFGGFWILL